MLADRFAGVGRPLGCRSIGRAVVLAPTAAIAAELTVGVAAAAAAVHPAGDRAARGDGVGGTHGLQLLQHLAGHGRGQRALLHDQDGRLSAGRL